MNSHRYLDIQLGCGDIGELYSKGMNEARQISRRLGRATGVRTCSAAKLARALEMDFFPELRARRHVAVHGSSCVQREVTEQRAGTAW